MKVLLALATAMVAEVAVAVVAAAAAAVVVVVVLVVVEIRVRVLVRRSQLRLFVLIRLNCTPNASLSVRCATGGGSSFCDLEVCIHISHLQLHLSIHFHSFPKYERSKMSYSAMWSTTRYVQYNVTQNPFTHIYMTSLLFPSFHSQGTRSLLI